MVVFERPIVGRAVVTQEIGIDAFRGQCVGMALIGTRFEFDTSRAVQNNDAWSHCESFRRIARHANAAFGRLYAELFSNFGDHGMRRCDKSKAANDVLRLIICIGISSERPVS